MNRRLQRVNELVKRELGEIIRRDFTVGEFGVVTVTSVEISPDLKNGRIFVSVIGTPQQTTHTLRTLGARRGAIQHEMSRTVILKYTPHLEFVLDETGERADRINRILHDLHLPEDESA